MSGRVQVRVALPELRRRKRFAFALTPLADAMFQLLIFFMLSSSLVPYSLLTLTTGTANAAPQNATPESISAPQIWNLSAGTVRRGSETFLISDLQVLVDQLSSQPASGVIVFSDATASVQDMTHLLNILSLSDVGFIELISREIQK